MTNLNNKSRETIDVDGISRSIHDSNGRLVAVDTAGQCAFWKWYGNGPIDDQGRPIVLYRGLRGPAADTTTITPNEGYAVFASSSPYVASTYANIHPLNPHASEVGAVYPIYARVEKVVEFPINNRFDMFEFDRRAKALRPGEALVARNVCDPGPQAFKMLDQEELYYNAADTWAFGVGASIKSAVGNPGSYCHDHLGITDGHAPKFGVKVEFSNVDEDLEGANNNRPKSRARP